MSTDRSYVPSEIWGDEPNIAAFENPLTNPDFVYTPCPCCGICDHCGYQRPSKGGITVAVDGACRSNGRDSAHAGYGVYFNATSPWNFAEKLHHAPFTNQRAELLAAKTALLLCMRMMDDDATGHEMKQIVIKSDSAYLVNGMVTHGRKWRLNDYTSSRGRPVVNGDLFRWLDERVTKMENRGVRVRFWHVPRAQNKQADKLANAAIDGVDWMQFTRDEMLDL